jgi:hypothetical protein
MYDLVGDIHGHAAELTQLLDQLGYRKEASVYRHPDRKMIFVGDFVDRGPQIQEVLETVRPMVDSGAALAVMGNHEFNAIAYHSPDPANPGKYIRPHSEKNVGQHAETVRQVAELAEYIAWFQTLPMWLELDGLRVVHACWDPVGMEVIENELARYGGVTQEFMAAAHVKESPLFQAIDDVLKGTEISLPPGQSFADKDGNQRYKMRIRWFESPGTRTYAEYSLSSESGFPEIPLPSKLDQQIRPYASSECPVFFGHYWLRAEQPMRLASNVGCLDFSVAKGGQLCAYRWDGEQELDDQKFVSVPAVTLT